MNIAVLGTGVVGRTVAARLHDLGHAVTVGTRSPAETLARTAPDAMGTPPFAEWARDHQGVRLATFTDATAGAELVVNATSGSASLEVLALAGADHLAGTVLLDIANPLDFSHGMPPSLDPVNTDSLAEQIQRAFPSTRVVKALNTMNASVMVDPARVPGDHNVFVSGDDAEAKQLVADLLVEMGWPRRNVLDLGDLSSARGTEMLLPLWLRLYGALGHADFNFHVQGA